MFASRIDPDDWKDMVGTLCRHGARLLDKDSCSRRRRHNKGPLASNALQHVTMLRSWVSEELLDEEGRLPLKQALDENNVELLQLLIKHCDIHEQASQLETEGELNGDEAVKTILREKLHPLLHEESDANSIIQLSSAIWQTNLQGRLATHCAAADGRTEVLAHLHDCQHQKSLSWKSSLDLFLTQDKHGQTPLHLAAINGDVQTCNKILELVTKNHGCERLKSMRDHEGRMACELVPEHPISDLRDSLRPAET
eukprot:NODE_10622_length_1339_cov_4.062706.p2 GENE.NODE_10622_length_1339_cov_4.062706~~NODE_10622_length_1339_cov_4.062706.p2  ORF type:complete len:254 (-),score=42.38 NODE_10622_length_1339_cov_4.062706:162-923(-)